jgi:cellulose synthase/poly-beta-1,6-N-acetylglucosamine synthase-like glycosyltransferase
MISLIVSHYRNLPALTLVFKTLEWQTNQNFEVIVAEDDNSQECIDFISDCKQKYSFSIAHVSHEKVGFRKCKILNDAVKIAKYEKLVFIDGDCILHKRFIDVYEKTINKNCYYYGRRVWLNKEITDELHKTLNLKYLSFRYLLQYKVPNFTAAIYFPLRPSLKQKNREIWGCNWGILKEYVLGVNGFDEDFTETGFGEDLHIGWRLRQKYNLELVSVKNKANQYHLYHNRIIIPNTVKSLYEQKIAEGIIVCKNGIKKL